MLDALVVVASLLPADSQVAKPVGGLATARQ